MNQNQDLSRAIIVILVIVSVVVSLFGTLTVLEEASRIKSIPVVVDRSNSQQNGKISITVVEPQQQTSEVTGKVVFKIIDGDYK